MNPMLKSLFDTVAEMAKLPPEQVVKQSMDSFVGEREVSSLHAAQFLW